MQFSKESQPNHAIVRYTADTVWIMNEPRSGSLALNAQQLMLDWQCSHVDDIDDDALAPLLALNPEVIVLGVGEAVAFPQASVMRNVMRAGVGIEVMNDGAAIRTFNVMLSEQRDVVLALVRGSAG